MLSRIGRIESRIAASSMLGWVSNSGRVNNSFSDICGESSQFETQPSILTMHTHAHTHTHTHGPLKEITPHFLKTFPPSISTYHVCMGLFRHSICCVLIEEFVNV